MVTNLALVPLLSPHKIKISAPLGTNLAIVEGRVADEQLIGEHSDGPRVHAATAVQMLLVLVLAGAGLVGAAQHLRSLPVGGEIKG